MRLELLATRWAGSMRGRRAWKALRSVPALGRIAHATALKLLPKGRYTWVTIPRGPAASLELLCDLRYEPGYVRGDHEPWIAEAIEASLREGDTFVDVGAHIGYFSVIAARLLGKHGRVVAIEPDPLNAKRLRANVARNHLERVVRVVEAAATATDGTAAFRRSSPNSSRVQGFVTADGHGDVDVRAVRLDAAVNGLPRLVKIDVEGGEVDVLAGAERLVDAVRTRWIVEVHTPDLENAVWQLFDERGYALRREQPVHPVYHDYAQRYVWAYPDRDFPP
jgi:FkbM family methyltransferase